MRELLQVFAEPTVKERPRLRYWWPAGYVGEHLEQLDEELKEIAAAGFGGIEIADVYDGLPEIAAQQLTPERYGFTSDNWRIAVKQALRLGKKYGLKVDLTISPHWPATTNEADPNMNGTAKELVYGTSELTGDITAGTNLCELCPPHYTSSQQLTDGSEIENKFIGLYVADHVAHEEVEMPPAAPWESAYTVISDKIDFTSLDDISQIIKGNRFAEDFSPTRSGQILIAIYQRGTGQRVNMYAMCPQDRPDVMAPYAYVVDHFSEKGAELIKSLWQKNFLHDEEFVELLKEAGDNFFEDSLELKSVGHWTEEMLTTFETYKGYDLKPFLPFVLGINQDKGLSLDSSSFKVEELHQPFISKLRHDYFEVLNHLYRKNHLLILKNWANSLGLGYRAQPYGWAIDSAAAATQMDIVEGESLGFGEDGNDAFRMLAAGRDFAGLEILSDEAGAYLFQGYATTLPQLLTTIQKNFMAGVNQTYWHGMPFSIAPEVRWPGFSAFNPMLGGRGFAEAWGPRQPVWGQMSLYTTYVARLQYLLRQGTAVFDLIIFQNGHNASENKQTIAGNVLQSEGVTYQVMTEGLMSYHQEVHNSQLVVKGATYQAILVDPHTVITPKIKGYLNQLSARGLPVLYPESEHPVAIKACLSTVIDRQFMNAGENVLRYQRKVNGHLVDFIYNYGDECFVLPKKLLSSCQYQWNAWTGKRTEQLPVEVQPKEMIILEGSPNNIETVVPRLDINNFTSISLNESQWQLHLQAWEMASATDYRTNFSNRNLQLDNLQFWSDIKDYEHVSGIGVYSTVIEIAGKQPTYLFIPKVAGAMTVSVNGNEVSGNPLSGYYPIASHFRQGKNTLEIKVASTLNNYLNDCPLTDYYGRYVPQDYGIDQAYLLY